MKKFILSLALTLAMGNVAHAQDQFFGINPDKFIALISTAKKMPHDNAMLIVGQTMKVLSTSPKGYRKALDTAIMRLSDPTDSIHNEEMLIAILTDASKSMVLSNNERMRPQALLESALKNRIGTKAADVDFVSTDGKTYNLLNNDNRFTLVYFNDPDCDACGKVKENLAASTVVKQAFDTGLLKVVAINPMNNEKEWKKVQMPSWIVNGWNKSQTINNGSYDLPNLPVFFLLGRDNTVLLKNEASLKNIEKAIKTVMTKCDEDPTTLAKLLFNN